MVQATVIDSVAEADIQVLKRGAASSQTEHGLIPNSLASSKVEPLECDKPAGYVGYPYVGDGGTEAESEHLQPLETLTDVKEPLILHLAASLEVKLPQVPHSCFGVCELLQAGIVDQLAAGEAEVLHMPTVEAAVSDALVGYVAASR